MTPKGTAPYFPAISKARLKELHERAKSCGAKSLNAYLNDVIKDAIKWPKKKGKHTTVSIYIDLDVDNYIHKLAEKAGVSPSVYIRDIIANDNPNLPLPTELPLEV